MYKFSKSQAARAKAMQKVAAKAAALRRLRKDRPDLHARVLSVIARLANEESPGQCAEVFLVKEGDWRHRLRERNAQMRADRPKMTIAALAAKYRISYRTAYGIVRDVDGPRAPPLPRSGLDKRLKADRNAKITAAYSSGATVRELAKQYAITFQRIHQIVQHESARLGRIAPAVRNSAP